MGNNDDEMKKSKQVKLQTFVRNGEEALEALYVPSGDKKKVRCVSLLSAGEGEVETNISSMTDRDFLTESKSKKNSKASRKSGQKESRDDKSNVENKENLLLSPKSGRTKKSRKSKKEKSNSKGTSNDLSEDESKEEKCYS